MTTFTFPLKGVHCSACTANIAYLLNEDTKPDFFVFKKIDISPNNQKLIIEIDDDQTSEDEVRRYITQTLAGSTYELIVENARHYWRLGAVGLGLGTLILILSVTVGFSFFPLKLATAFVSIGLTYVLGAESFRKARIEIQRRKLGMDSLFLLSTGAATLLSLLSFVVPGLPIMFESSLLIFGFRHIGIALKKSIYSVPNLPVRYQRITTHKSSSESEDRMLKPGDRIAIKAGDIIPLDGWLMPMPGKSPTHTYPMDVSRIKGSYVPEHLQVNDPVAAGMVAKVACMMQIGLGHDLRFSVKKPSSFSASGQISIYPDSDAIKVTARSDLNNNLVNFILSHDDFQNLGEKNYYNQILTALRLNTLATHLTKSAKQQLSRVLVQRAAKHGLTKTVSSMARIEQELEDAGSRAVPIQNQTDRMLQYFVPIVLGVALISGAIAGYFFTPLIAVRCIISILVSACPCTLGFVTPLVMDFTRVKGQQAGVVYSQSDAIETISACDIALVDLHGTATKGKPEASIVIHDQQRKLEIERWLARLEQHSEQHVGKAIYAKLNGDALLRDTWTLPPSAIEKYSGGIGAKSGGQQYVLGNCNLLRQLGAGVLTDSALNTTYLLEKVGNTYRKLATISIEDSLRSDTPLAIAQLRQRGLKVYLLTGTDQHSAEKYARDLPGLSGIYAGYSNEQSKLSVVRDLQARHHRVLMVGDGANDASAMKEAHASIAMKHGLSDEGAHYLAKARILSGNMLSVVDAFDIAQQAMWRIKLNLLLSLIYNLAVVLLTNILVLSAGIVIHPGICAALMVAQVGMIMLSTYYFKNQPLPTQNLVSQSSMFRPVPLAERGGVLPERRTVLSK